MADVVERMPAPPAKPIEEWTSRELLSETVRQGLINSLRFQQQAIRTRDSVEDEPLSADEIRLQRLVDESARGWGKILAGIQLSALHQPASEGRLVEYEAAVERQEKLLGLRPSERTRGKPATPKPKKAP